MMWRYLARLQDFLESIIRIWGDLVARIDKQFEFMREIDGLKQIFRQTYIKDASRKENDAEHSWHLAVMAILFAEYANEKVDVLRVISMVLVHDMVELDAGDTYAYDVKGNETKRERELLAADRIFAILPKDQAEFLRSLWDEFEEGTTPEAKFAHTLDNLQPMMLNAATDGLAWKEHEVHIEQLLKRNEHTAEGSDTMWDYAKENFIKPNMENGLIKNENDISL